MQALFYQWIDFIWLPIGFFVVHKGQRLKTLAFILACLLLFRTQLELMASIGHPDGFLGWIKMGLYERGLIVYGILFTLFLILAHLSPNTKGVIFMAAALSLMILGFCISMIVMVF